MPTAGQAAICASDDFSFDVLFDEEAICEVRIEDTPTLDPGQVGTIYAIYRGKLTSTGSKGSWNIYLYNRSDTNADGSARVQGNKTTPSTGLDNIVITSSISPNVPEYTKPVPSATEILAIKGGISRPTGYFLDSELGPNADIDATYWNLTFQVQAPLSTGNNDVRIHEDTTTFYGSVELLD